MKLGVPWTLKGRKSPGLSARSRDAEAASVQTRLDDLTRQVERLSRVTAGKIRPPEARAEPGAREEAVPGDPHDFPDGPRDEPVASDRIASSEVERHAGEQTLNRNPLRPVYGDSDLDRTMAEIAARQRALDSEGGAAGRGTAHGSFPAQNLSRLEETLRKITLQVEALRRPCPFEDAAPALRQELSDISRSLAEAVPRQAIEAIEAEVRGLGERLGQSRQSGIDGSVLANLERGLAEVRDALQSLRPAESLVGFQDAIQGLSRKIDGIVATQQDPAVLQQLESAITGLRSIVAHVASDDTLARLTEEVRGISARLEHAIGSTAKPDALANLERQVGAIAEAIDAGNAQDRHIPGKLETMVRELGDKIEKQQLTRGDTIAVGQLEERVAKLVEKLDAAGSRFNHLEAIERGLTDILVHLEEQRARSGAAGHAASVEPAVESLKRDLDTVNGTLNRVVERLATIESGMHTATRLAPNAATTPAAAMAAPADVAAAPTAGTSPSTSLAEAPSRAVPPMEPRPQATAVAAQAPILPATTAKSPPSERLAAAAQAQRPPASRERAPIDPNLPPDHPLEPGAAYGRTSQSAADRIAASKAAVGPGKPPVITDPGRKTNFIAAARQAAQAASRLPKEPGGEDDDDKDAAGATGQTSGSLRQRLTGRLRSMLVGAGVLILVIGAVRVAMMLFDPGSPDAPDMSPQQQTAKAPAIAPAPKSTARVIAQPTVSKPPRADEQELQDTASPGPVLTPPPGSGSGHDPTPAPQHLPAPPEDDVTGSIPPTSVTTHTPPAVPLPPNRPDGQVRTEPQSRLAAAAAAGDPAAAYELALRYIDGRGVRRSYADAAQWLTRAAAQGLAPAQFRLGSFHEKGLGVRKDLNEAQRLYAAAAAQGNAKAMHNLAVLHAEGGTATPDYTTAVRWFRKAGDRGIADSQYNLGVLFARGVGVEQNLAESYKWFALAAKQGDKEAARKRDDIAARLDAESLMAARLAVRTWTMEPQPKEAVTVSTPPGGWDQTPPVSTKRRSRTGNPLKLGPG